MSSTPYIDQLERFAAASMRLDAARADFLRERGALLAMAEAGPPPSIAQIKAAPSGSDASEAIIVRTLADMGMMAPAARVELIMTMGMHFCRDCGREKAIAEGCHCEDDQ